MFQHWTLVCMLPLLRVACGRKTKAKELTLPHPASGQPAIAVHEYIFTLRFTLIYVSISFVSHQDPLSSKLRRMKQIFRQTGLPQSRRLKHWMIQWVGSSPSPYFGGGFGFVRFLCKSPTLGVPGQQIPLHSLNHCGIMDMAFYSWTSNMQVL